jgi:hypothetical protein
VLLNESFKFRLVSYSKLNVVSSYLARIVELSSKFSIDLLRNISVCFVVGINHISKIAGCVIRHRMLKRALIFHALLGTVLGLLFSVI